MTEHWSNPKPDLAACACGCGLVGRPRAKAWQDGLGPHVKRCACRRCAGGRQKGRARVRENRIAADTGGERSPLSGALSGYDGRAGNWVWEETTNAAFCRGFLRWINSKTVQTKIARLMSLSGVNRAIILSVDNKPLWVVVPYSDWVDTVTE